MEIGKLLKHHLDFHPSHFYIPIRFDAKEQLLTFIVDGIFVVIFVIALIFHSHQTEATYRLDFIWKLQATGTFYL